MQLKEGRLNANAAANQPLHSIFVYALAGLIGGFLGFMLDYFLLQQYNLFGVGSRLVSGVAVALSFYLLLGLPRKKLPIFLLVIPLLWLGVDMLGDWALVQKAFVVRAGEKMGLSYSQLAQLHANTSSLYPFASLVFAGAWLALGLIIIHAPARKRWGRLILLGISGGLVGIIVSFVFSMPLGYLYNQVLQSIKQGGQQLNDNAKLILQGIQVANNSLIAGVQIYLINLFLLFPLRRLRRSDHPGPGDLQT